MSLRVKRERERRREKEGMREKGRENISGLYQEDEMGEGDHFI